MKDTKQTFSHSEHSDVCLQHSSFLQIQQFDFVQCILPNLMFTFPDFDLLFPHKVSIFFRVKTFSLAASHFWRSLSVSETGLCWRTTEWQKSVDHIMKKCTEVKHIVMNVLFPWVSAVCLCSVCAGSLLFFNVGTFTLLVMSNLILCVCMTTWA